ncbi:MULTISPECIES: hypothetical protein [Clostridioides]|uniref:hypothetical protein n=1 Tax=Clostridioides TaxID=1870884 RepID=UPI000C9C4D7A|nr:hypothetical protein [Clostridioides difficile]
MNEKIYKIEDDIDKWLIDELDKSIPRNKYIYHCNLAFIDIIVDQKVLFTPFEKHYLFSLTYNTNIAHRKLQEEEDFDYMFDEKLYILSFNRIILGFYYSILCDIFPLLHSKKGIMEIKDRNISFKLNNIPKKNFKYINDYSIRKTLSYTLQIANKKLENCDDEEIAIKLSELYMNFWSENMVYEDYEPYSRLDWSGIGFFFIVASMRRFNKLYKEDFDIVSVGSHKMMIILSPNGVKKLREYVPATNEELYKLALEDNIYKPIEDGYFPKLNISEAPLNMTKDGYIFVNPLVMLFNDSMETRFLNYLRKCDNKRYLRIKDKIKERVIPLIIEMIKYKLPNVKYITNFHVRIPLQRKNERECDLLLIDRDGFVLYLEIKHFYNPQSFCETKKVDGELKKALDKMPEQLSAIKTNWENIKKSYEISVDLMEIQGVIVSHYYLGYDLDIDENTPIVNASNLYESIAESNNLKEVFLGCKEIDDIYPKIEFVERELNFDFAKYNFTVGIECLHPRWEILLNKSYKDQICKKVMYDEPKEFKNLADLAKAYLVKS